MHHCMIQLNLSIEWKFENSVEQAQVVETTAWMGGEWPTSSNSQAAWSTTSFSDHTWLRGPIFLDA